MEPTYQEISVCLLHASYVYTVLCTHLETRAPFLIHNLSVCRFRCSFHILHHHGILPWGHGTVAPLPPPCLCTLVHNKKRKWNMPEADRAPEATAGDKKRASQQRDSPGGFGHFCRGRYTRLTLQITASEEPSRKSARQAPAPTTPPPPPPPMTTTTTTVQPKPGAGPPRTGRNCMQTSASGPLNSTTATTIPPIPPPRKIKIKIKIKIRGGAPCPCPCPCALTQAPRPTPTPAPAPAPTPTPTRKRKQSQGRPGRTPVPPGNLLAESRRDGLKRRRRRRRRERRKRWKRRMRRKGRKRWRGLRWWRGR